MKIFGSLVKDINKIQPWMFFYLIKKAGMLFESRKHPKHLFLCFCDHFEPLRGFLHEKTDDATGLKRVRNWAENYPVLADNYRDSDGYLPKHTFFYPVEEYRKEFVDLLADLCHRGYGELEIHLHHSNDSQDNFIRTINDFKNLLVKEHGLLSKDKANNQVKYGFIHGNWALDNSKPDGSWCGINNELTLLELTGCYADFTMPSAPDITQTSKVNSIYYAIDDPLRSKSHNSGIDAQLGKPDEKGLLCVQGPLLLNWKNRKWGVIPKIENSSVNTDERIKYERLNLWVNARIEVKGNSNLVFVKLHTHGCVENNTEYLFKQGFNDLFSALKKYNENNGCAIHYVSAREMVNIIKAIEIDKFEGCDVRGARNYKYKGVWEK